MRSLQQCLLDSDLVHLRVIARFWDLELTASRQRDAAVELAAAMAAPEVIAHAWQALPAGPRQALEALLAAGGKMPLLVFARAWGEIRAMGPARLEREQPWQSPVSPAEGLWYGGFISRAFDQGPEGAYEAVFVPPELLAHLPVPPTPPQALTLAATPAPVEVRTDGDTLLDDACTLLAYLQNKQVRPDADGSWPAHHEARLARQLHDAGPQRLAFLRHLVQRLGWLRASDSGRVRPEPSPVAAWLQSSPAQQRNVLAAAWRDDPTWNDLFHVPTLAAEDTGAWRNDPLLARQAILRHLQVCTPEAWYSLDNFVAALKQADPDFQRPGGDYATWYIRDAATGAYLSGFESWGAVEGALVRYLITSPLAWLGLTDLGFSAPASCLPPPVSFCLTLAGAAFLDLADSAPEAELAPLALRPDFTVLVPAARRYERFQLARVADWVRTAGGATAREATAREATAREATARGATARVAPTGDDDCFVYRITPASLERARRQGIPVPRVLEFLGKITSAPVPRFVEAALTRWDARGAEVKIERAVLLRLSNEELMAQIASSPSVHRLIHEQIGPTVALVSERDWPRLIPALGEAGLLPEIIALEETHAG